jgi:hypothetical protein
LSQLLDEISSFADKLFRAQMLAMLETVLYIRNYGFRIQSYLFGIEKRKKFLPEKGICQFSLFIICQVHHKSPAVFRRKKSSHL